MCLLSISLSSLLLLSSVYAQSPKKDKEGPNDADNEVIVYDFFENEENTDVAEDLGSDEIIIFPFFSDQEGFTLKQWSKHKRSNHWNFVEIETDSDLHAMENPHQKEIKTQNFVMKTEVPQTKTLPKEKQGKKISNNWAVRKVKSKDKVRKPRKLDDKQLEEILNGDLKDSQDNISDRNDVVNIAVNIESIFEEPLTVNPPKHNKQSGFKVFNEKVILSNNNGKYRRPGRSPRLDDVIYNKARNYSGTAFKVFKANELQKNEIPEDLPLISKVFINGNLHKKNKSLRKQKKTKTIQTKEEYSITKPKLEPSSENVKSTDDTTEEKGYKKIIIKKKPQKTKVQVKTTSPSISKPTPRAKFNPSTNQENIPRETTDAREPQINDNRFRFRESADVRDLNINSDGFRPYYPRQSPIQQKSAALLRLSSLPRPPLPPVPKVPYFTPPQYPQQPPVRRERGRTSRNINSNTKKSETGFLGLWRSSRALLAKRVKQLGVSSPFNLNKPAPPVTHARDVMIETPARPPPPPARPLPPYSTYPLPRQDQKTNLQPKPTNKSPFDFLSKLPKLPLDVLNFSKREN